MDPGVSHIQGHCKACNVLPIVHSELRNSSSDRLLKRISKLVPEYILII